MSNILNFFPRNIANLILQNNLDGLEEIRVRVRKAYYIKIFIIRNHHKL